MRELTLTCARCGATIATLALSPRQPPPEASLCRMCSTPAYYRFLEPAGHEPPHAPQPDRPPQAGSGRRRARVARGRRDVARPRHGP